MTAKVEAGARLNRQVSYFSKTFGFFPVSAVQSCTSAGFTAAGLSDGNVIVFKKPLTRGIGKEWIRLEKPLDEQRILPVREMKWFLEDEAHPKLLTFNHRINVPSVDLILWDIFEEKIFREVSFNAFDVLTDYTEVGSHLFWIQNDTHQLCSTLPGFRFSVQVKRLVKLSNAFFLAVGLGLSDTFAVGLDERQSCHCLKLPNEAAFEAGFASRGKEHCKLVFEDSSGTIWLALYKTKVESPSQVTVKYIKLQCWAHDPNLEDVYFDPVIFVLLHPRSISIHDAVNGRLLQIHPIPNYVKGYTKYDGAVQRPVVEDEQHYQKKRILDVRLGEGLLLLKWGRRDIQVWNFGSPLATLKLEQSSKSPTGTTIGRRGSTSSVVKEELQRGYREWQEEREEEQALTVLRQRFNPEGMTEKELVQQAMAMSLSLGNDQLTTTLRLSNASLSEDDDDLRHALELSLTEM